MSLEFRLSVGLKRALGGVGLSTVSQAVYRMLSGPLFFLGYLVFGTAGIGKHET